MAEGGRASRRAVATAFKQCPMMVFVKLVQFEHCSRAVAHLQNDP